MLAVAASLLAVPSVALADDLANASNRGSVVLNPAGEGTKLSVVGIDANGRKLSQSALPEAGSRIPITGTPAYFPTGAGARPNSIVGEDDRYRVPFTWLYPSSAVVYITLGGEHLCTGWMVSKDTLITAGHCLYDSASKDWYHDLEFSPGADEKERPFGTVKAAQTWLSTAFIDHDDQKFDWGIVKLNSKIGYRTGWFGMKTQEQPYLRTLANLRGYPGDKPSGQMWSTTGFIHQSNPFQLCYTMDTIGGQSGSPVYNPFTFQVMAIHTYGVGYKSEEGCPSYTNAGSRITADLYRLINQIR